MIIARKVTSINWDQLMDDVQAYGHVDPEELVHEIVHIYLCDGKEAFEYVGKPSSVNERILKKYTSKSGQTKHEIKTSAITYLILEPLGQAELEIILSNMRSNIEYEYINAQQALLKFNELIIDSKIKNIAVKIKKHLIENYEISTR